MGLTGIIYGSIVVAWAAYLIPLALRRHEQAARTRSIDRFSTSMNVLSGSGRAGRVVVTPRRACDRVLAPEPKSQGLDIVVARRRPSHAALQTAARRRRRVLLVLTFALVAVTAAAVLRFLPLWSIAVPAALVVLFLTAARLQVRRASEAFWVEAQAPSTGPTNVIRRGSTRVDASSGAVRSPDDEPTVPLNRDRLSAAMAALEQEHSVAVTLPTSDGTSLWDPLPVVLPTYVEKAAAAPTIRTVDLSPDAAGPAGVSSADSAKQASESEIWVRHSGDEPTDAAAADAFDDEPARVVNG